MNQLALGAQLVLLDQIEDQPLASAFVMGCLSDNAPARAADRSDARVLIAVSSGVCI